MNARLEKMLNNGFYLLRFGEQKMNVDGGKVFYPHICIADGPEGIHFLSTDANGVVPQGEFGFFEHYGDVSAEMYRNSDEIRRIMVLVSPVEPIPDKIDINFVKIDGQVYASWTSPETGNWIHCIPDRMQTNPELVQSLSAGSRFIARVTGVIRTDESGIYCTVDLIERVARKRSGFEEHRASKASEKKKPHAGKR